MMMMFCRRQWMRRRRSSAGFQGFADKDGCGGSDNGCDGNYWCDWPEMEFPVMVTATALLMLAVAAVVVFYTDWR
ncbi:hypothetical protein HanPI659440_Chr17g0672411 [Helianthus annuus]|nr:hypothetical protein HanPI659440_Chr17g0672411 [Helianthus annuus]